MTIELRADSFDDVFQKACDIVKKIDNIEWVLVNKKKRLVQFQDALWECTVLFSIQTNQELDLDKVADLISITPGCASEPSSKTWLIGRMKPSRVTAAYWSLKEFYPRDLSQYL